MTRDVTTLLVSEMDRDEWTEFRLQWVDTYITEMMVECGATREEAETIADIRFEDYVGQEGWTGRDEDICAKRAAKEDSHKYFAS